MKQQRYLATNLWSIVDALQRRFEELGCEPRAADAAVIRRVDTLLKRRGRNDQAVLPIRPVEA